MVEQASGSYSFAQLEALWIQAGGNKLNAAMAAAIAMAESGGNPNATNDNGNGSVDRGLWQINSSHGSQSTYDPVANARAAVSISNNGASWRPWCTAYSDGLCGTRGGTYLGSGSPFQKFLGNAGLGTATSTGTNTSPATGGSQYASFPTTQDTSWYNWIIPFGLGGITGGTTNGTVGNQSIFGLPLGGVSSTIESGIAGAIMDVLKPVGRVLLYTAYVVGGVLLLGMGGWYMLKDTNVDQVFKPGNNSTSSSEQSNESSQVEKELEQPAPQPQQGGRSGKASKQGQVALKPTQGGTGRRKSAREGRTAKANAISKAEEGAEVAA